jgi:ABC-type antimicrobial peptide transport system permease subunit
MKSIIMGIAKNPLKNALYVILLATAFTPITLFLNTHFMGQEIMQSFNEFHQTITSSEELQEFDQLFEIQRIIQTNAQSLFAISVVVIFLCVVLLPFLQYILSLGRGYEIGVLRTLGLSKGRAWLRLLLENILLIFAALLLSFCSTLVFYKNFAFSLLAIDSRREQILLETLDLGNAFAFNWQMFVYTLYVALAVTLFSSALSNVLISNSAPLKLIQKFK